MPDKNNIRVSATRGPFQNGVCCNCGFSGEEETVCPAREDKTHCVHWFEGPDGDNYHPTEDKEKT